LARAAKSWIVDVRDCARLHIALMNDASTNGRRHFSFAVVGCRSDLAEGMQQSYPGQGLTKKVAGRCGWRRAACARTPIACRARRSRDAALSALELRAHAAGGG